MCICGVARPLYFRASLASNPFIWLRLFSAVGRRSIFSAETSAASWRSRSREGNVGKREEAQLRSTFSKAEMELVYRHDDRQGRVCGLVAAYALRDKVCLTAIGQLAAKDLLPSQTPDFLCLYTQEGRLEEAATVVSFLCQASEFSAALTGSESPLLKAEIEQWVDFFFQRRCNVHTREDLSLLNLSLQKRTFLCGTAISLADLLALPSLYDALVDGESYRKVPFASRKPFRRRQASAKELASYCNLVRWMNHVQHLPGIKNAIFGMPVLDLPVTNPTEILSAAAMASEQKADSKADQLGNQKAEQKAKNKSEQKADKKTSPKTEKGGSEKAAKQKQPQPQDSQRPIDDPMRLDMRVGFVKEVWKHPDADGLYCEEIDFGPLGTRRIASGLVKYLPMEEFKNQKVVVLFNLKPKALRGFESHGMVLCASSAGKESCQLIKPPPDTPLGERVVVEGLEGEPDEVLSTKKGKDCFAVVQPVGLPRCLCLWTERTLRTDAQCFAFCGQRPLVTSKGAVRCDSIANGSIS